MIRLVATLGVLLLLLLPAVDAAETPAAKTDGTPAATTMPRSMKLPLLRLPKPTAPMEEPRKEKPPEPKAETVPPPPTATPVVEPAPPEPAVPLPEVFVSEAAKTDDVRKLGEMRDWIDKQVRDASSDAEREVYEAAERQVMDRMVEVRTAGPVVESPPARGRLSDIDLPDCAQLRTCAFAMGLEADLRQSLGEGKSNDFDDTFAGIATEVGRAAYEGGPRGGAGTPERDTGTADLERTFARPKSVFDATPYHRPGKSPARRPGSVQRVVPPLPTAPRPKPKGVLIAHDRDALMAATARGFSATAAEDRLIAVTDDRALFRFVNATTEQAVEAVLAGRDHRRLDNVIVVSLADLVAAAEKYRDRWSELPGDLRHPGGLRRIFGYVVDAEARDVELIGSAEGGGAPISIDELIVGVDAVWRRGVEPMVSLEPDPNDMAGPHKSMVYSIPFSSRFAKVMLDADYEMKFITLLGRDVTLDDFPTMIGLMKGGGQVGSSYHRFWFMPSRPRPGDVVALPGGRAYLFDAGLVLRTEEMLVRGGMMIGNGAANPAGRTVAAAFTSNLAELEVAFPVIRELHALVDVTMMASIWRLTGLDLPVLHDLAGLPVAEDAVPESYAGLHHTESDGPQILAVTGGVKLGQPVTAGWLLTRSSPAVVAFLDRPELKSEVMTRRVGDAGLEAVSGGGADPAGGDERLIRASQKLAAGEVGHAYLLADRLVRENPLSEEALTFRAEAGLELGLYRLAERDLHAVQVLNRAADAARLGLVRLAIREGRVSDFAAIDVADRRELANLFLQAAVTRIAGGQDLGRSLSDLEVASRLDPDNGGVYAARASVHLDAERFPEALADLDRAIVGQPENPELHLYKTFALIRAGDYPGAVEAAGAGMPLAGPAVMFQFAFLRGLARVCRDDDPAICDRMKAGFMTVMERQKLSQAAQTRPRPSDDAMTEPYR